MKKLKCWIRGHKWTETNGFVVKSVRTCSCCGRVEYYLTGIGSVRKGWVQGKRKVSP